MATNQDTAHCTDVEHTIAMLTGRSPSQIVESMSLAQAHDLANFLGADVNPLIEQVIALGHGLVAMADEIDKRKAMALGGLVVNLGERLLLAEGVQNLVDWKASAAAEGQGAGAA